MTSIYCFKAAIKQLLMPVGIVLPTALLQFRQHNEIRLVGHNKSGITTALFRNCPGYLLEPILPTNNLCTLDAGTSKYLKWME